MRRYRHTQSGMNTASSPPIQATRTATWRSPADALATRFYHWQKSA